MVYKMVAETMAGKQVIIRTLDIGADKQCDYFNMDPEDNPGAWLSCNPNLSDQTGSVQNTTSCLVSRQRIW